MGPVLCHYYWCIQCNDEKPKRITSTQLKSFLITARAKCSGLHRHAQAFAMVICYASLQQPWPSSCVCGRVLFLTFSSHLSIKRPNPSIRWIQIGGGKNHFSDWSVKRNKIQGVSRKCTHTLWCQIYCAIIHTYYNTAIHTVIHSICCTQKLNQFN